MNNANSFYVSGSVDINPEDKKKSLVIEFLDSFKNYLSLRIRQALIFFLATIQVLSDLGSDTIYRSSFHLVISVITIGALFSGLSNRLNIFAATDEGLNANSGLIGRQDILSQSGTAETIFITSENTPDYPVYKHKVEQGETLSEIAELYQIKPSTIRWANGMSNDTIKVDQILRIPGIDGAFIKVKQGDTLESIAEKNKGNVADILDLNSNVLDFNNPELKIGMELFIPGGEIPAPPKPVVASSRSYSPPAVNSIVNVPSGTLINPVSNCSGYAYIRGFTAWHGGVDLAKKGGCWLNSAGAGRVIRAGWGYGGEGFHVVIDHGGGVWTRYYHGNGRFAVSTGDYVQPGQSIMYMGCTGYCTGTHLHFEVVINGIRVNPESYVRVR